MRKWVWIERSVILAAHEEQLADHGGSPGIRDAGLLDSALARPLNRAAYAKPDAAELAAAYAFGLAANHLALVEDAAFHVYARGAVDYSP